MNVKLLLVTVPIGLICTSCLTNPESVRGWSGGGGAIVIGSGGGGSSSGSASAPMAPVGDAALPMLDDPDNNIEEWRDTITAMSYSEALDKCQRMAEELSFLNQESLPVHYRGISKTNSKSHWANGRRVPREYECIFGTEVYTPDWERSAFIVESLSAYNFAEAETACTTVADELTSKGQPADYADLDEVEAPYTEDGYEYAGVYDCTLEIAN